MSPSSPELPYTPRSVASVTTRPFLFLWSALGSTWPWLCTHYPKFHSHVNRLQMTGKDMMRKGLQSRHPWGTVRLSAWHCRQQVKNIHDRLRKIAILWRCTGAGAPAFSNPTLKILCIKGNTVLLLATCQVSQVWLFSLFTTFIYSSFFSFPIHLSSCLFAPPSARRLPLSHFLAPFPLSVLLQGMQRWWKYVMFTGHCNVTLRKKGKEVIVPFKKWAVIIMLWVKMK